MADVHKTVEGSSDVVRRAVEAMEKISGSSRKVGHFIGIIDEIVFQTNLLALNAGVEAARAGEAGAASRSSRRKCVRWRLRAAEAAKEIKTVLGELARHVEEGVEFVGAAGDSLNAIAVQVTAINAAMAEVSVSAECPRTGCARSPAAADLDKATQQNAAMAEHRPPPADPRSATPRSSPVWSPPSCFGETEPTATATYVA